VASKASARGCHRRRFADDVVVGFQRREGRTVPGGTHRKEMRKFNLELHPRNGLLEICVRLRSTTARRGEGKAETFNFLGFTHICVKKRTQKKTPGGGKKKTNVHVLRQTTAKRTAGEETLVESRAQRACMNQSPTGKVVASVVSGTSYYGGWRVAHEQPRRWLFFDSEWDGSGIVRCRGVARNGRVLWNRMRRPSLAGCLCYAVILIPCAAWALSPKQEPDAGNPPVRIRGGGVSIMYILRLHGYCTEVQKAAALARAGDQALRC